MADIGQDQEGLELTKMEIELRITEKRFSQQRIRLEVAKLKKKVRDYEESIIAIDSQILEDGRNLTSVQGKLMEILRNNASGTVKPLSKET